MDKNKTNGVVVNPKPAKKKKKNKCCGCLLTVFVTFVILLVGIFATGMFVGDYYTREYLDMSITDVLGVYGDIRTVNKKNLGLNEFSDADAAGFETALKEQLFIKRDVEIPYGEIFDAMFSNLLDGNQNGNAPVNAGVQELRESFLFNVVADNGIVLIEDTEKAAANPLVDIIVPLLSRDNIDLEKLAEYNDQTTKKLSFSDKELAGFINKMVRVGIDKIQTNPAASNTGGFDTSVVMEKMSVASVRISGTQTAPMISVICKAETRAIANNILSNFVPTNFKWAADFGTWLLLPKETYVSVELKLGEDPGLNWRLNGLSDEKMARLTKLLAGVGKLSGQDLDIDKILDDSAGQFITPVAGELNHYMEYDKVGEGKLSTDLFGTVLTLTGVNNDKAEQDKVLPSDMYFTMKALLLSEPTVNTESTFRDQYLSLTGDTAGEVVYLPANFDDTSEYRMVDYQEEFMAELREKYLLNDSVKFSEISKLFGIGAEEGGSDNFIDKINFSGNELSELAKQDESDTKLVLTDRMLGVLFDEFLDSILGEDSPTKNLDPQISHVTLKKLDEEGEVHNWIEAAFTVDILGAAGDNALIRSLIEALLKSSDVMLTVEIDITPNQPDGYHGAGKISYNDLSKADTERLLGIIHKFAPDTDFSAAGLLGQIEPEFRKVINEMFNILPGIELGKSAELDGKAFGGMEAGSVFAIAAKQLSEMAADENEKVSAAELRGVVVAMWDIEQAQFTARPTNDDYAGFMDEIKDKYYLNDTYKENELSEPQPLDSFDDLMKVVDPANFLSENIRVRPEIGSDQSTLAYDNRTVEELRAYLSDQDFGAIMKSELEKRKDGAGSMLSGFTKVESARLTPVYDWDGTPVLDAVDNGDGTGISPDGTLTLILNVDVKAFMDDSDSAYLNLLPDTLYLTLRYSVSPQAGITETDETFGIPLYDYYDYSIQLNGMVEGDEDYESLMKVIRLANNGNNPVEIHKVAKEISRALYEKLEDLRGKLGDDNLVFYGRLADPLDVSAGIEYGFRLGSVYHFLEMTGTTGAFSAEHLQEALQGMYAAEPGTAGIYNYNYGEVVTLPVDTQSENPVLDYTLGNPTATVTFTDTQFGYQLKTNGELIPITNNPFEEKADSNYTLVQFAATEMPDGNGAMLLEIVFEVEMNDFIAGGEDGARTGYHGLVPDTMYFTFRVVWEAGVYTLDVSDGVFTINSMSNEAKDQLFALIGYDPSGLENQLNDCVTALSGMTDVSYAQHEAAIVIAAAQIPPGLLT